MTEMIQGAIEYAREHGDRFVDELLEMLRIPSVGADPAYAADTRRNAEWLANHLAALGLDNACVMETAGHPVVYAEWMGAGPDRRTVLVYGHYDVVPATMEDGWDSDPFEPVIKDGKIFGRGTTDDKGQLFIHVKALESFLKTRSRRSNRSSRRVALRRSTSRYCWRARRRFRRRTSCRGSRSTRISSRRTSALSATRRCALLRSRRSRTACAA